MARRCFCFLHTAHHHLIAPTAQCGKTALIIGLRQRRNAGKPPSSSVCANGAMRENRPHHRFAPTARCEKNRRRAVSYVSTGLACLPRDTNNIRNYRRRAVVYVTPRLANNLYNRSSAVDSLIHNQPQVGKPTWGYNYTTALRRLPHPSATIPKTRHPPIGLHLQKRHPPIGHHPQNPPIIIGLRKRRNAKKTAEERFHTLARGWLAYPVTSIHSHLPPKSGCRNPIPRFAILVLFNYFRNKMFYELHRCIIPHRFFDKRPRSHSRQRASR